MTHIKLKKRNITFNNYPVASDSHGNKTYFCYATLASCQKQVEKILAKGLLPKTAEITGLPDGITDKGEMKFKLSVYQGDGYWFQSEIRNAKKYRLWVPFKDETKLKEIAEKNKKQ